MSDWEDVATGVPATSTGSDWEDVAIEQQKPWNLFDAAKQFGSGGIEGNVGLLGFLADIPGIISGQKMGVPFKDAFRNSQNTAQMLEPLLPAKDPDYRYSRTLGNFLGPATLASTTAKGLQGAGMAVPEILPFLAGGSSVPKSLVTNASAALGAQGLEDVTGDSAIAPLVGAVLAGGGSSAAYDSVGGIYNWLKGIGPENIQSTAAKAFKDYTDLTPKTLDDALAAQANDINPLSAFKTTAELTDNAAAAQLQLELASADQGGIYNRMVSDREGARTKLIDSLSTATGVNREGLGTAMQAAADDKLTKLGVEEANLWQKFPRNERIQVKPLQKKVGGIVSAQQGGLPPGSKVRTLIEQILPTTDDDTIRTSGALQDIRSSALSLLRDANLSPIESRVLGAIADGADTSLSNGLKGEGYDIYKAARELTAGKAQLFNRSAAGGAMVNDAASPANVLANSFKGDSRSAKQIKQIVGSDSELLEQVKRGVIDPLTGDTAPRLTATRIKKFINANEGGLQELMGKDYGVFAQVADDLVSAERVSEIGNRASARGSQTAQRLKVGGTVKNLVLGTIAPGSASVGALLTQLADLKNVKLAEEVNKLLIKAALKPEFALELVKTPTNQRVMSVLEHLITIAKGAAATGAAAATLQIASPSENDLRPELSEKLLKNLSTSQSYQKSVADSTSMKDIQASPLVPPVVAKTEPIRPSKDSISQPITKAISKLSTHLGKDLNGLAPLVTAVIAQESGGNAKAKSTAGAQGLMQLMPATGKQLAKELGETYRPNDAEQNVKLGSLYLTKLLPMFDYDLELALTAYHSGENRVKNLLRKTGGKSLTDIKSHLGPVGKRYAESVLGRLKQTA
jgi:soluble lytic murein transglycosylase-like protein